MPFTKNSQGRYEYVPKTTRQPGLEGIAMSGFSGSDLNLDGNNFGLDGAAELSVTGTAFAGVYSGLLKFLELEPLVKIGAMTRKEQLSETKKAAWEYTKDKAVWILTIAALVAFLPALGPIFGALGFIGLGTMSYRVCRQFYMALNDEELEKLRKSAANAGIDLNVPEEIATEKADSPTGKAAGYNEVDPLPDPA